MYLVKIGNSADFSKNVLDILQISGESPTICFVVFYQPFPLSDSVLV